MGEINGARGKKKIGRRPVARFYGEGRGGGTGGVDAAWRQNGRERGGPWARRGAALRCGVGALPRDTGGRRGQRDGGPVISGWVRRGEAVGAALTGGGRQHSVPDSVFKPNQIDFKRIQICPKL
jgi:hypothetical protein